MFYEFDITVPKNTAAGSPKKQVLKLAHGIIQRIDVQFPIGTLGLARCRLLHHTFGQLPTNPQGSFSSDGYIIHIESPIEFYEAPYEIKAVAWNTSTKHPHTITVRFDMVESKSMLWFMSLFQGLAKMLKLVGIKV